MIIANFINYTEINNLISLSVDNKMIKHFRKKDLKYIVDAPVSYSSLADGQRTREEIADILVKRCNELGKMDFSSADSYKKIEK